MWWDTVSLINSVHIRFKNVFKEIICILMKCLIELFLVMGKAEGLNENWHGHVTCLTVCDQYRRQGLAAKLMNDLEATSEQ